MAAPPGSRGAARLAAALAAALAAVVILAVAGSFGSCGGGAWQEGRPSAAATAAPPGALAHAIARVLAGTAPARAADTWGEIRAREFVVGTFQQYGYTPRLQEFIARHGGRRLHSANVIAVKEGAAATRLVLLAHYDAAARQGFRDNATGVGLLLELAARLKRRETPYTLVFVACGAGASGNLGTRHYARSMDRLEREATLGVIDLDAVAGGEGPFVASRAGRPTWLRDDVLAAATLVGQPLAALPAAGGRPAGLVGGRGDDLPFALLGLPTALVTAPVASRWPAADTVAAVESASPGRVRAQLRTLSRTLETLLTSELERRP